MATQPTGRTAFVDTIASASGPLAVVVLGLSAGAILVEGVVFISSWRAMPPESFLDWYAANASRLVDFFGPLEVASALFAAAAGICHRGQRGAGRTWFFIAAILAVAVLGIFPLYFQRVNASFAARTIALDGVASELARYAAWHWIRTVIAIGAFAAGVLGVGASGAADPSRRA